MSKHVYKTCLNLTDLDSLDVLYEVPVEIEYTYLPGSPEVGPTYSCGGQPAEGPEIHVRNVWIMFPGFMRGEEQRVYAPDAVEKHFDPYKDERLFELMAEQACDDRAADHDRAMEARAEMRREA